MHRLLSYKGYVFPEVRREDAAVLNPSDVSSLSRCRSGRC
jgi:ADP-ribosylation factor-binding protein GGA